MQQSFKNGETCPADGIYYCEGHYRTSIKRLKAGDIFPNCTHTYGHTYGTTWINYDPEEEDKKPKRKYGR